MSVLLIFTLSNSGLDRHPNNQIIVVEIATTGQILKAKDIIGQQPHLFIALDIFNCSTQSHF